MTDTAGPVRRSYQWEASADRMPGTDGLAYLRAVVAGELAAPPVAATLGFDLVAAEPGTVVVTIVPAAFHHNPIGLMLGGVGAAVCDAACGCAVLSLLPPGARHTTQNLNTSFVREVTDRTGPLTCTATVSHLGRHSALAEARLVDADDRLHVHATSTFVIRQ